MTNPKADSATGRIRRALLSGEALTRPEACERFGITGSTFQWLIKQMRDEGIPIEFDVVRGNRNAPTRRWKVGTK